MKRLLAIAAVAVALVSPARASAQDFVATGGNVIVTVQGFQVLPFQLFLAAAGANPEQIILDETGTQASVGGGPYIDNALFGATAMNLGPFDAGTALQFGMRRITDGVIFTDVSVLRVGNGFKDAAIGPERDGGGVWFSVAGIDAVAVVTPEPASLVLLSSGLLAIGAVARKRTTREE